MTLTDTQVKSILNRIKQLEKLGVPRDLSHIIILMEYLK